jgi:hypothetical protein
MFPRMGINTSVRLAALLALLLCGCSGSSAVGSDLPAGLPEWLLKSIQATKASAHPGTFEEATYEGQRVFEFIRGDRADTGDEHILFSEDGKEICEFGGIVGHVTSGTCSINKIVYVRTLYSRRAR